MTWYPDVCHRVVFGDNSPAIVGEWWERAMQEPWGPAHPAAADPSILDSMLPLFFHYDGAEAYSNQEAHIWSCGSCFAGRSVHDAKWMICTIMNVNIPTPELQADAHETICRFIGWSLEYGMKGVGPESGFYGEKFLRGSLRAYLQNQTLGVRCCFGGLKADKKAAVQIHRFRRHWSCTFICESCLAVRPTVRCPSSSYSFGHMGLQAAWK